MKKITVVLCLIACTSYTWAQSGKTDFREDLQFGIKGGANYSNVYSTSGEEFEADAKFGLATGIFIVMPINKLIGLQPAILYSEKGFKGSGKILGSSYDVTRTTSYIDVPIFVALKPNPFVTVLVGPQYSFLIQQRDVFTNGTTTIEQEKEFENDNIRKNTFCFAGGLDLNIGHIVIGPRVGVDVLNNNGDGTSSTPRYKNVWYQLTLAYRFY